jgi:hypothetical protein
VAVLLASATFGQHAAAGIRAWALRGSSHWGCKKPRYLQRGEGRHPGS